MQSVLKDVISTVKIDFRIRDGSQKLKHIETDEYQVYNRREVFWSKDARKMKKLNFAHLLFSVFRSFSSAFYR